MPYCPQCGTEISSGRFCPQCGAQIGVSDAENPYAIGTQTQYAELGPDPNAPPIPGFVEAYARFWKMFGNIEGRASRREFWYVWLWNLIITLPIIVVFMYAFYQLLTEAGVPFSEYDDFLEDTFEDFNFSTLTPSLLVAFFGSFAVLALYGLAILVPQICLLVRRVHDFNVTGWLAILCFLPKIKGVATLVFGLIPPTQGPNKYGAQPRKRRA
ncbi:MAG: DUF805 domain-containing protein [Thermoguttaceae bacterium]|nr:DUF805 domain-containing protein [Thermoguttaceae bacterium]